MKRLFAAIKITPDEQFLKLYWNLRNSLKHEKIKWVEEENLHLTLKFFGETFDEKIKPICEVLDNSVIDNNVFSFQLENLGIFGSSYDPKVIWFGIKNSEEIQFIYNSITENLRTIGYYPDRQNFVPHLSVARIRKLNDKKLFQRIIDKHKQGKIQVVEVEKIYLFESILQRSGPIYNIVKEFPLNK